jgi:hypothetical protein
VRGSYSRQPDPAEDIVGIKKGLSALISDGREADHLL